MVMIERTARALCRLDGKAPDAGPAYDIETPGMTPPDFEPNWKAYIEPAKAVLAELQNPTDAMADAGARSAHDRVVDLDEADARQIFAAMIDAALFDGV